MNKALNKSQSLYCIIMALWKSRLHDNSICQFNHDLDYSHGWFYFDDEPAQRMPEIVAKAKRLQSGGAIGGWEHVRMSTVHHIFNAE